MLPFTSRRHSATLLLLGICVVLLLHFYQLNHANFTRNYIKELTHYHEVVSQAGTVPSQSSHELDDPLVSYDHVVSGENRTVPHINSQPPKEETWLLSPSDNSSSNNNDGRIPRIINKIYFQKDGHFQEKLPPDAHPQKRVADAYLQNAHQSWSSKNPGYTVRYFNLMSARKYLYSFFHPTFLRTFDCIQAFAGKSDFFRVALLYREGGFHSDWKMVCLDHNLLDLIANATDFFVAIDVGNRFGKLAQRQSKACATNAFVGSTMKHPILALYLEIVMVHVQQSYYPSNGNPLFLTGPCAFGQAVRTINKDFGNDTTSWPLLEKGHYYWNGKEIILTKCKWCGGGQDWSNGNNYNVLARNRTYYCEDSASIFQESFQEAVSSQGSTDEVGDLSVRYDLIFGENRTMPLSNSQLPKKETWLLSPSNSSSNNDGLVPSVSYDHVFAENRTGPKSNSQPPKEETWLLSPSDNSSLNNNDGRIPRIINKIYFQKDGHFQEKLPPDANDKDFIGHYSLRQAHQSWSSQNPGYTVRYFNLMSAREYLYSFFHPTFLRTFDCIQAFAGKSDFFRMALLYREGGFHTDWKMACMERNLLDRIANASDFFAAIDVGNRFGKLAQRQSKACATNAFVGSTMKHPILALYLEIVMVHVQQSYYPSNGNPLFLTGPCAFGQAVRTINKDFGNDTTSWPLLEKGHYYWNGKEIILTKCKWCGGGQDWSNGNNYNVLARNRTYYCEDSASIFREPFR